MSKIIKIGQLFLNLYEWMFFLKHGVHQYFAEPSIFVTGSEAHIDRAN